MNVYTDISAYDGKPSVATVGLFDGVHLGHQSLLRQLTAEAHNRGLLSLVVTLHPHPRVVLSKGNDRVGLLTTLSERTSLISSLGVDRLLVLPFTRQFSDLSARQFIANYLRDQLSVRLLLLGYNHRFGSDNLNPDDYIRIATDEGLIAERQQQFTLPHVTKISSSEVRRALSEGNIELANTLLGRPYLVCGKVVHGDALGRTLNAPTANLNVNPDKQLPADGVYAALARTDDSQTHLAIVNIGTRPTLASSDRRLEAHIIDYDNQIYGQELSLLFLSKIRNEQKFDNTNQLKEQIQKDEQQIRAKLSLQNLTNLFAWFDFH